MQKIDILLSTKTKIDNIIMPIELKAVTASKDNIRQIKRYMDWLNLYYYPNIPCALQPVLLCKKSEVISNEMREEFIKLKNDYKSLPLIYIEHYIKNNKIIFERVAY